MQDSHLQLRIQFQVNDTTPVIRFRYTLAADQPRTLSGANKLTYLQTSLKQLPQAEEVTLSNFAQLTHSYTLDEQPIGDRYFSDSGAFMGPILAASDGHRSFLLAYEHGSQVPDAFLRYQLSPDECSLAAVKGNYAPVRGWMASIPLKPFGSRPRRRRAVSINSLPPIASSCSSS